MKLQKAERHQVKLRIGLSGPSGFGKTYSALLLAYGITPRHNSFIDAIIQSKCHVIATTRSKVDYSLDKDSNGKTKVMKLGTKSITREGFEYELTVNFEFLNDKHLVQASKIRKCSMSERWN